MTSIGRYRYRLISASFLEGSKTRSLSNIRCDAHDAHGGAAGCDVAACSAAAYSGRARDYGVVWVLNALGDGERASA